MNESDDPDHAEDEQRPGKTRTWWYPLLVRLLDFELAAAYKVQEEVLVGKLPLRVDIVLIRRESGQLPEPTGAICPCCCPLHIAADRTVSQDG